MTTLIHVGNSEGTVGRCDARCYEAVGERCECICGGRNHGVGLKRAVEQMRQLAEREIAEIEALGGYVAPEVRQLSML